MLRRLCRSWRSALVLTFDLLAVLLCWGLAYQARFNFSVPPEFWRSGALALLWVLPAHALAFHLCGLYRGIWAFASLPDLMRMLRAVGMAAIAVMIVALMVGLQPPVPRSVFLLMPVLLIVAMGGSRMAYRAWREYRRYGGLLASGKPVIVIGAGAAGAQLVRELSRSAEWRAVAILDDALAKRGREMFGVPVVGATADVAAWAERLDVQHAIVAMPSAALADRRRIFSQCVSAGLKTMVMPAIERTLNEQAPGIELRAVELDDLLGREPVQIDTGDVHGMLGGRVVMVTGAGGSIGSELCTQIARFSPAQIIAFELSEFALYTLTERLKMLAPDIHLVPVAGNVRDTNWVRTILERYRPAVVFHAAAYKHVPLMEEENAWQAVRNNVLGTWRLASAAIAAGVERFVLISTDKAVNPTNVMGASKRLAEMVCQRLQMQAAHTRFSCVRFGNVLGSAGSVVPKFTQQIREGGPVTVTHPDIIRYFMSIPEAAQLVIQAAAMGQGGEIFVMDMGKPVRIVDLARAMIRLAGASEEDVPIEFTGLRPGEKLFEELLADSEHSRPTHHPKLRVANARTLEAALVDDAIAWLRIEQVPGPQEVRSMLRRWVPEYQPAPRASLQLVPDNGASRMGAEV